ncbi:hypothetical protein BJ322DRAFT_1110166 [Thelephora terrestris]|uniref:Transmembrane protein n=1 Tax=Thelephora terrestris TaxID=56493 RepID=A0A9P6HE07_9AGAM|nr:hypothetical protein BJ322DRAFT_1110166 [Thelephora terrestris]
MSDVSSPDPNSRSVAVFNPIGSANRSGAHTRGTPAADAPHDSTDPDDDGGDSGEETVGDTEGLGHRVWQHTGSIAGEPISGAGSFNAAVNQVSQTILVNISPSDSNSSSRNFRLTVIDTPGSEFLRMNVVVSWRYAIYISGSIFIFAFATYITCAAFARFMHEFDRHYECSRQFRGPQELRVGSSKQEPALPQSPHRSRTLHSSVSAEDKGDQRVKFFPNERSRNSQREFLVGESIRATEPSRTNSSEPEQEDPVTALERARALVAASTQDPEVPTRPFKPWKPDNPTSDDPVNRQKRVPPSIRQDQPIVPLLPSSLHGRYGSRGEPPPIEHRTQAANPRDEGMKLPKTQERSRVDDKDRPLTVRDMEFFTKAIQGTIREMSSEFIEALAEMRQSEDIYDDDEAE